MDLAFGGDVDDDVARDAGLAAQTPASRQAADAVVARFDGIPGRERVGGDGDPVFGEFAVGRCDLAFGADAAAATDGIEIDPELAGGGQHGGAWRDMAALARRGEDHVGIAGIVAAHCSPVLPLPFAEHKPSLRG